MCRFLAYFGDPVMMETQLVTPSHSLIHQSLHAAEAKQETNGDGFGLGWYGERPEPGLYRDVRPAWSDENLRSITAQVRSRLFFAHVRAATDTATSRANCHPFAQGRHLFMHNGQVAGWKRVRRRVEGMIPDALYERRTGTTDSEALFLAALARGLDADPVGAMAATLREVKAHMREAGVAGALRFTAAVTDGRGVWAFRWACDARPPTLYYREQPGREQPGGLLLVSEPTDGQRAGWREVPVGGTLIAERGRPPRVEVSAPGLACAA